MSFFFPSQNIVTDNFLFFIKGVEGVNKIKDGYNPATWMLEVTNASQEEILGVNFADMYKNSDLYQYVFLYIWICLNLALFIYVDLT